MAVVVTAFVRVVVVLVVEVLELSVGCVVKVVVVVLLVVWCCRWWWWERKDPPKPIVTPPQLPTPQILPLVKKIPHTGDKASLDQ